MAIKAQVPVGGRGKAGGIKLVKTPDEAREAAAQIIGMDIKGFKVPLVYCETALDIEREIYLGFTVDRDARNNILMLSAKGGMDIEQVAEEAPESIARLHPNPVARAARLRAQPARLRCRPRRAGAAADRADQEALPSDPRARCGDRRDQPARRHQEGRDHRRRRQARDRRERRVAAQGPRGALRLGARRRSLRGRGQEARPDLRLARRRHRHHRQRRGPLHEHARPRRSGPAARPPTSATSVAAPRPRWWRTRSR